MHYNELQLRGVEVEAIAMKFEQRVADEVAKAGHRQKPGPKHQKKKMSTAIVTIRRGKPNHSEWNSQENSTSNSLNPMAPPWKLKKNEKDNFSTAMEV
jgi:hypothetical protein